MKKILVLLVILALAGAGYYFWKENKIEKMVVNKAPVTKVKNQEKSRNIGKGLPKGGLTEYPSEDLKIMAEEIDDEIN